MLRMRRRECQRGWISGPPPLVSRETEPALQSLLCEAPGGPLLASAPHLSDRAMALCSLEGVGAGAVGQGSTVHIQGSRGKQNLNRLGGGWVPK